MAAQLLVSAQPALHQPFGAIGGMPLVAEHLCSRILMGRVNVDYAICSIQNSHAVVLGVRGQEEGGAGSAAADAPAPRARCTVVEDAMAYLAMSTEAQAAAHGAMPGYDEEYAKQVALTEAVDWVPPRSMGRYGALYQTALQTLANAQKAAAAYEAALARSVQPPDASRVVSFATLMVQSVRLPEWYALSADEARVVAQYIADRATTHSADVMADAALTLPAEKHYLRQRADKGRRAVARMESAAGDLLAAAAVPGGGGGLVLGTVEEATPVLHMGAVVAHPASKGSGSVVIQRVCDAADALRMPVLIEALCGDGLPLYYARQFGFHAVMMANDRGKRGVMDRARLERKGWVQMLRWPKPAAAAAEEGEAAAQPMTAEEKALAAVALLPTITPYSMKEYGKLQQLHLTPAALRLFATRIAVLPAGTVASGRCYANWAKEAARQVRHGDLTPALLGMDAPGEEVLAADAAARAAQAVQAAQRGAARVSWRMNSDDDDMSVGGAGAGSSSSSSRRRAASTAPTQDDDCDIGEEDAAPPAARRARVATQQQQQAAPQQQLVRSPPRPAARTAAAMTQTSPWRFGGPMMLQFTHCVFKGPITFMPGALPAMPQAAAAPQLSEASL